MSPTKNNTPVYLAAFALLALGLGVLMYVGMSGNSTYFVTVSEALALEDGEFTAARLFGLVDERDLRIMDGKTGVEFRLLDETDASKVIPVSYHGAIPDAFKPGAEVIVEGAMNADGNLFEAKLLITKCPSKYESDNREL